jgi:hypothetical protein
VWDTRHLYGGFLSQVSGRGTVREKFGECFRVLDEVDAQDQGSNEDGE